jgi:galactokinase
VGLALTTISGIEVEKATLALAGQQAEHEFVGIRCGIMDQFTGALGRAGHALLIDCRTLDTKYIALPRSRVCIVICDTRVKHELATSEYNTRRTQCERGAAILRELLPGVQALRDVSMSDFQALEGHLPEPIRRCCRHVVTENMRTLAAARALNAGNLDEMGRLMFLSHASIRDDFAVSCGELDLLVEIAQSIEAVIGARMTGGGFGGCTVNLVFRDALEEFLARVSREYERKTHTDLMIYVSDAAEGAREFAAKT